MKKSKEDKQNMLFDEYYKKANWLRLQFFFRSEKWRKYSEQGVKILDHDDHDVRTYCAPINFICDEENYRLTPNAYLVGKKCKVVDSDTDNEIHKSSLRVIFTADITENLVTLSEELDKFKSKVIDKVKLEQLKSSNAKWLNDYIRSGRSGSIKDALRIWQRCLKVYDLRMDGLTWEKIAQDPEVNHFEKSDGTVRTESSVIGMTKRDYKKALQLIESAQKGTFPD